MVVEDHLLVTVVVAMVVVVVVVVAVAAVGLAPHAILNIEVRVLEE